MFSRVVRTYLCSTNVVLVVEVHLRSSSTYQTIRVEIKSGGLTEWVDTEDVLVIASHRSHSTYLH